MMFVEKFSISLIVILCNLKQNGWAFRWMLPELHCPGESERTSLCMSECSSCDNRDFCAENECRVGCSCKYDYYRENPGGKCIHVSECPYVKCSNTEVFRACGPRLEACSQNPGRVIDCSYKCFCKESYKRNANGTCIAEEECPINNQCSFNERMQKSGRKHEFCGEVHNETIFEEKCYCLENFRRNIAGHCMNSSFCQADPCFEGETLYDCIPTCRTTCDNYEDEDCIEDGNCFSGCFCLAGTVMSRDGNCIPVEECNMDKNDQADEEVIFEGKDETSEDENYSKDTDDIYGVADGEDDEKFTYGAGGKWTEIYDGVKKTTNGNRKVHDDIRTHDDIKNKESQENHKSKESQVQDYDKRIEDQVDVTGRKGQDGDKRKEVQENDKNKQVQDDIKSKETQDDVEKKKAQNGAASKGSEDVGVFRDAKQRNHNKDAHFYFYETETKNEDVMKDSKYSNNDSSNEGKENKEKGKDEEELLRKERKQKEKNNNSKNNKDETKNHWQKQSQDLDEYFKNKDSYIQSAYLGQKKGKYNRKTNEFIEDIESDSKRNPKNY